jgi:methyl-accepting chemotaxis protein
MRINISTALKLFGAAACLGLLAIVGLSSIVLARVEISGPIYNQIAVGEGIEGDIEPPPLYVVEAYLDANLAAAHPRDLAEYRAALADLHQQYDDRHRFWQGNEIPPDLKTELQQTSDADVQRFWQVLERQLLPAIAAGDAPAVSQSMSHLDAIFRAHRALVIDIINKVTAFDNANQAMAQRETRFFSHLLYAGAALVLLLIAGGVLFISRKVVTPIDGLSRYMKQLATGELSLQPPYQGRSDEIGDMGKSVAVFRDAMIAHQEAEAQLGRERATAEAERAKTEAAREAALSQLNTVVKDMSLGLDNLAKGDLKFRLLEWFPLDFKGLRMDYNQAMDTIQLTMTGVVNNTQNIQSSAHEITQASDDLSRRTEQQAASLEQTAAALDQITSTVRKTAEGADEARKLVADSKADAENSGSVIHETITAMNGIEKSSKEIGNIIGVIDEIAFQTNLLALNAGIEAARAGEAGRGFAVVATEVRALAQRSTTAAKEIKDLISASGQQVESGVKLVGDTGRALSRIATQVDRLNTLVSQIAVSAREQAIGLAEVNTAVSTMDQVTQQNAAMVEETTAASHSLAREAAELSKLVSVFQIDAALTPQAKAPVKTPAPVSAAKSRAPAQALHTKPRLVAATADADRWDEF